MLTLASKTGTPSILPKKPGKIYVSAVVIVLTSFVGLVPSTSYH